MDTIKKKVSTNQTQALSVQGAQNQAIMKGSPIQYDEVSQSPWYEYWEGAGQQIVWFEGHEKLYCKI